MRLRATVSASADSDSYDGMTYIYCYDPRQGYCFSLTCTVGADDIEVMVVDQVIHRVDWLPNPLFHRTYTKSRVARRIQTLSVEASSSTTPPHGKKQRTMTLTACRANGTFNRERTATGLTPLRSLSDIAPGCFNQPRK
jgi:hypothetical protein